MFGMTLKIRSEVDRPLIVQLFEPFPDSPQEKEITGVLVPPHGEGTIFDLVALSVWLRAFDAKGELIYTVEVPKREFPRVTIPAELPSEPAPIPQLDVQGRTGFGTDCDGGLFD